MTSCLLDLLDIEIDDPKICCFQYPGFMDVKFNVKTTYRIIVFVKRDMNEMLKCFYIIASSLPFQKTNNKRLSRQL